MITDLSRAAPSPKATYDVLVVGSGPAGGTLASELATAGLRVLVLESGRERVTARGDSLRQVESEGLPIKEYSRERVLGGTSSTWAGLSSPLDDIDLGKREWLSPGSAWPFGREELLPCYASAAERYRFPTLEMFGIDARREDPQSAVPLGRLRGEGELKPTWTDLREKIFLARDEPQHFGRELRDLYEGEQVDLWLDATVTELLTEAGDAGTRVTSVRVKPSESERFEVSAPIVVLACGGIENARLLLASRSSNAAGLGNDRDQVGRYFMNHPKNYRGIVELSKTVTSVPYFFGCMAGGFAGYAGLRFDEQLQRERKLLNTYVRFEPLFPWSDNDGVESLVALVKRSGGLFRAWKRRKQDEVVELRDYAETGDDSDLQNQRQSAGSLLGLAWNVVRHSPSVTRYALSRALDKRRPKIKRVRLRNFLEMEPDPDNRVVLSEKLDPNGVPIPKVVARCTELDRRTLIELHRTLTHELEASGVGRLTSDLAEADPWPIDQDASHHLGTTRMGADPETSVVDPNGRVHGTSNLYCAGGSVFPTSGCANPTFTIVALSIRLAKHLAERATPPAASRP